MVDSGLSAPSVSEEDDEGFQETAYLLGNPANARRLLESIAVLEAGYGQAHDLKNASAENTSDERFSHPGDSSR
ncbi:MAG: hypothetical protein Q4D91_05210 [Lautropia sp.]|nr:hypothetical protein [Lautropia sp.]